MAPDRAPGDAQPHERPQAPTNPALGRAIRRLRRKQGITIEALSLKADMHITYLSQIERGLRNPTWHKLCGLAVGLDTPISTIAREAEHDSCPVCRALNPQDGPEA